MVVPPLSKAVLPKPELFQLISGAEPRCGKCKKVLDYHSDRLKTKRQWWTNCRSCRDKNTAAKHRQREARIRKLRNRLKVLASQPQTDNSPNVQIPAPQPLQAECSVCAESFSQAAFPALLACTHGPEVCQGCFLGWLEQQMDSKPWDRLECPVSGCSSYFTHQDVKHIAPEEVFTRFDTLSTLSFLSNDPDFRYCPSNGCNSGKMHDTSAAGYIFRCVPCGYRLCTTCNVPFHFDETCTHYRERVAREKAQREEELRVTREQEVASLAEVSKVSMECPGCGANIEKTSGCDHMTYRRPGCHFQFFYVCLAPYGGPRGVRKIGNSAHTSACGYHSSKIPNYGFPAPAPARPATEHHVQPNLPSRRGKSSIAADALVQWQIDRIAGKITVRDAGLHGVDEILYAREQRVLRTWFGPHADLPYLNQVQS